MLLFATLMKPHDPRLSDCIWLEKNCSAHENPRDVGGEELIKLPDSDIQSPAKPAAT